MTATLAAEPATDEQTQDVLDQAETPVTGGYLALRPDQTELDAQQRAAFNGLGINPDDRDALPHISLFLHSCQAAGLDPWRKQAYLIKRGTGNNAKFTSQTGIEGFRLMGQRTGRFRRRLPLGWVGPDEDPTSWRYDPDDDIDKPRWQSVWIGDTPPVAARCVIEHYADDGTLVRTEAVARWADFAPYMPVYVGKWGVDRQKKLNPDGSEVLELAEMWAKMGPHMLAKCAEAACYRSAFAAACGGFYAPEEMHRADAEDIAEHRQEAAERRMKAHAAARAGQPQTVDSVTVVDSQRVDEPTGEPVGGIDPATGRLLVDDVPPVDDEPLPAPATREELLAELAARADLYGKTIEAYLARTLKALADERGANGNVTIADLSDAALLAKLAGDGQGYTAHKLRDLGRVQDAEHVINGGWLTDGALV